MSEKTPDCMRASNLRSPYYGLPPVDGVVITLPFSASKAEGDLLQTRRKYLELELLATNALINACGLVNRLPDEILVLIMRCVQDSYGEDPLCRLAWLRVLHVCRHWFVVASTTPVLWRYLAASTSLSYFRTALARSASTTISVSLIYPPLVPTSLQLLASHTHRLRELSLTINLREDKPCVATLLQQSLPVLERLAYTIVVFHTQDAEDPDFIELSPDRFPQLRHVLLKGVCISPSPILPQLATLHLWNWDEEAPGPTLDDFTEILQGCVNIEELHLKGLSFREDSTPSAIARAGPTALPRLRWLHITGTPRTAQHALSILSPSPKAHVTIQWSVTAETPGAELEHGFLTALPDDRRGLAPFLSHLEVARTELYYEDRRLVAYADALPTSNDCAGPTLVLSITRPNLPRQTEIPLFDDVLSVCRDMPLEDLQIDLEAYKVLYIDWRTAFMQLPRLRKLAVSGLEQGAHHDPGHLLRCLSPVGAPEGVAVESTLVCPALRVLRIQGFDAQDNRTLVELCTMLKARQAVLGGTKALEELELELDYHRTDEYFELSKALYTVGLQPLVGKLTYTRNLT